MKACIINIGDEILIGDTLNTNAHWMASQLDQAGVQVNKIVVTGDDESSIIKELESALEASDIILFTGGLGPTHDDITKHTLCRYFRDQLIFNENVLNDIKNLLSKFGRSVNDLNKGQAMVPSTCEVIRNSKGTAPGMIFRKGDKLIVSMPGVPFEMRQMMTSDVLPRIQKMSGNISILHCHLKTFGIPEAGLAEQLKSRMEKMNPLVKLAFLPSPGHVKLRLSIAGENQSDIAHILKETELNFRQELGDLIYGTDDDTLSSVAGELLLREKKSIVTAESCTGGRLASELTSVAGSSAYFLGSVIAYSNEIKIRELNVSADLIQSHGAVSEEVVMCMAENARIKLGADFALATSGIAGPDGGTEEKPVGTIWIGLSGKDVKISKKLQLGFNRKTNISLTADHALNLLRKELSRKT